MPFYIKTSKLDKKNQGATSRKWAYKRGVPIKKNFQRIFSYQPYTAPAVLKNLKMRFLNIPSRKK
jgi:hypothetical protein